MPQYDDTNKGALFLNDRKTKPTQPDYKGSINVNGVDHWISGWVKSTSRGDIVSLSIEPKDQNYAPRNQQPQQNNGPRPLGGGQPPKPNNGNGWGGSGPQSGGEPPMDFDDDIPF